MIPHLATYTTVYVHCFNVIGLAQYKNLQISSPALQKMSQITTVQLDLIANVRCSVASAGTCSASGDAWILGIDFIVGPPLTLHAI